MRIFLTFGLLLLSLAPTGFASSFEREGCSDFSMEMVCGTIDDCLGASRDVRDFVLEHREGLIASFEVGVSVAESAAELIEATQTLNYPLLMRLAVKATVAGAVAKDAKDLTQRQCKELRISDKVHIQFLYVKNFRDIIAARIGGDLSTVLAVLTCPTAGMMQNK